MGSGGDAIEAGGGVEDLAGLNGAVEDAGQQVRPLGAERRRDGLAVSSRHYQRHNYGDLCACPSLLVN